MALWIAHLVLSMMALICWNVAASGSLTPGRISERERSDPVPTRPSRPASLRDWSGDPTFWQRLRSWFMACPILRQRLRSSRCAAPR
jgi:hypothetical protein